MKYDEILLLTKAELNVEVAKLEGEIAVVRDGVAVQPDDLWPYSFTYCDNWVFSGRIIHRERIMIEPKFENGELGYAYYGNWRAVCFGFENTIHSDITDETPLLAAMRAYVMSYREEE